MALPATDLVHARAGRGADFEAVVNATAEFEWGRSHGHRAAAPAQTIHMGCTLTCHTSVAQMQAENESFPAHASLHLETTLPSGWNRGWYRC